MDPAKQPKTYEISELADLSGFTVRTIRYYIQQQLIPSSQSMGPGASYPQEALDRLVRIRQLQRDNRSLAEIREELGLPGGGKLAEPAQHSSAFAYAQSLLGKKPSRSEPQPVMSRSVAPSDRPRAATSGRSQWERYSLTDDIEIHVRRPLNRADNRDVERLLDAAKAIFKDQP